MIKFFQTLQACYPSCSINEEKKYASFSFGSALHYELRIQKDAVRMLAVNYPKKAGFGECFKIIKNEKIEGKKVNGKYKIIYEAGVRNPELFTLRIEIPYSQEELSSDEFIDDVIKSCDKFHERMMPLINAFQDEPVKKLPALMGQAKESGRPKEPSKKPAKKASDNTSEKSNEKSIDDILANVNKNLSRMGLKAVVNVHTDKKESELDQQINSSAHISAEEAISKLKEFSKTNKDISITLNFGKKDLDEYLTEQGNYQNTNDEEQPLLIYQYKVDWSLAWRKGHLKAEKYSIAKLIEILSTKTLSELTHDDFSGLEQVDCKWPEVYEQNIHWSYLEEEDDGPENVPTFEDLYDKRTPGILIDNVKIISQEFNFSSVKSILLKKDSESYLIVDRLIIDVNAICEQLMQMDEKIQISETWDGNRASLNIPIQIKKTSPLLILSQNESGFKIKFQCDDKKLVKKIVNNISKGVSKNNYSQCEEGITVDESFVKEGHLLAAAADFIMLLQAAVPSADSSSNDNSEDTAYYIGANCYSLKPWGEPQYLITSGIEPSFFGDYATVEIGAQSWMSSNLNTRFFSNGDPVHYARNAKEWNSRTANQEAVCCDFEFNPLNGPTYGKYYNWYALNDLRGITPISVFSGTNDWKIPNVKDWEELFNSLDSITIEKDGDFTFFNGSITPKLKSDKGWKYEPPSGDDPDTKATGETEFAAIGSGVCSQGEFILNEEQAQYWCPSTSETENPGYIFLDFVFAGAILKTCDDSELMKGRSVRCVKIKDEEAVDEEIESDEEYEELDGDSENDDTDDQDLDEITNESDDQDSTVYLYGFVDKAGREITPCRYDDAGGFSEGLAKVQQDGLWGYIDKNGKEVVPLKYDRADSFSEGLAKVQKDGLFGFIDKNSKEVVPLKYDVAFDFSEGLAKVQQEGLYGFIDKNGKEVVPLKYSSADSFSEGLAKVTSYGLWGFIDKTGKEVVPLKYDFAFDFSEGLGSVQEMGGLSGYIDKTGKEVVPFKYDAGESFSEGLAKVTQDGLWGYIDKNGKEVVPLKYDFADSFSEGLAKVQQDGLYGFVDKNGKEVVPLKYDVAWHAFSDGLASVGKYNISGKKDGLLGGLWGYIDKNGKEVVPLKYDFADDFSEGLAKVQQDGLFGFIDKNSKEVVPLKYDRADSFSEGLAKVQKDGLFGFIDKNGKEVVPLKYNKGDGFSEGFARIGIIAGQEKLIKSLPGPELIQLIRIYSEIEKDKGLKELNDLLSVIYNNQDEDVISFLINHYQQKGDADTYVGVHALIYLHLIEDKLPGATVTVKVKNAMWKLTMRGTLTMPSGKKVNGYFEGASVGISELTYLLTAEKIPSFFRILAEMSNDKISAEIHHEADSVYSEMNNYALNPNHFFDLQGNEIKLPEFESDLLSNWKGEEDEYEDKEMITTTTYSVTEVTIEFPKN